LLNGLESVESIKRLPIAAFENNDAASRCAEKRGGDQPRNAAANDAYGAFRGFVESRPKR
jgi:hypothetical protein